MDKIEKRIFEYLRVSITDRCNLRCTYCMPAEGVPKLNHDQILRYEEILKIIKVAAFEGIQRVRITGGEPLVRKGIVDFIASVVSIKEIIDVSMTTNGILLKEFACELKAAGLKRVNISLDSLCADNYSKLTRGGNINDVLAGIDAAVQCGLKPVKINVVIIPGENDSEVMDFVSMAFRKPLQIRFIERMPFLSSEIVKGFLSQDEIMNEIREKFTLEACTDNCGGGPAEVYKIRGGVGEVGFISSRTNPFCRTCNRLRLTSAGVLMPCLDSSEGTGVRNLSEDDIRKVIREIGKRKRIAGKPCAEFRCSPCVSLSDIGG